MSIILKISEAPQVRHQSVSFTIMAVDFQMIEDFYTPTVKITAWYWIAAMSNLDLQTSASYERADAKNHENYCRIQSWFMNCNVFLRMSYHFTLQKFSCWICISTVGMQSKAFPATIHFQTTKKSSMKPISFIAMNVKLI